MWKVRSQMVKSLTVRIDADLLTEEQVEALSRLFDNNRGTCKLYFDLLSRQAPRPQLLLSRSKVIDPTDEVMQELTNMFGRHGVVVAGDVLT